MMYKISLILLLCCFSCNVFASDKCSKFKFNPTVNINNIINDKINISKSDKELVNKLGYTASSIEYGMNFLLIPVPIEDGFCVSLRSVDVNIKFPEFNIVIDKKLKENSCAYNIVLKHETDHVKTDKNILSSNKENIKKSVLNAAQSINPVFLSDMNNIEKIKTNISNEIKNHKDIADIIKKIKEELATENEKIDTRGDIWNVWQCEDFFEEMKNSYDKITID